MGARRVGPEGCSLFFLLSHPNLDLFSPSLGASRGIMAAIHGRGPPKMRVWAPWGHSVKPRRPVAGQGSHKMTRETETLKLAGQPRPWATIPREDPHREKISKFGPEEGEKKTRNFETPTPSAPLSPPLLSLLPNELA